MLINAVSNGLGSQSMYLLVLAAKRQISATISITADTGAEQDCLWSTGIRSTAREFFDQVVYPYCAQNNLQARFVRAQDKFKQDLPDLLTHVRQKISQGQAPALPLFGSRQGQLRQGCTEKWKIRAIHQEARRLGATQLRTAQGIHYGESSRRVKGRWLRDEGSWSIYQEVLKTKSGPIDVKWCTHYYPLVDLKMYREDTRTELIKEGLSFLESSECDHCPHKDLARWDRTSPEKLIEISQLETEMNGEYFFTAERIPLMKAIEKMRIRQAGKLAPSPDFGCGNSHCGI